jgi:cytidylate kinase
MDAERRRPIVVAIDGPAGAGKSTVSKRLTALLGYRLLDTGALYRSVALLARQRRIAWSNEAALAQLAAKLDVAFELDGMVNRVFLSGQEVTTAIRTPEMSEGSSIVSALPAVRAALLERQRALAGQGGVVAEGRDVGTVVLPGAEAKFFLTASDEVRAERRVSELRAGGIAADYQSTLADIQRRDDRDSSRETAPLTRAPDAVVVDSSTLTIDEVVAQMTAIVKEREARAA